MTVRLEDEAVKQFLNSGPMDLNSRFRIQPRKRFCTPPGMPFTETLMGMECPGVVESAVSTSAEGGTSCHLFWNFVTEF